MLELQPLAWQLLILRYLDGTALTQLRCSNKYFCNLISQYQYWYLETKDIDLRTNGLLCTRPQSNGYNNFIQVTRPLSRLHPSFKIKIHHVGTWVSFGVAERMDNISYRRPCGENIGIFNCGYYSDQNIRKIEIAKEKREELLILNVPKLRDGDMISVEVDFTHSKLIFHKDNYSREVQLDQLSELYPTVSLGHGCLFEIINPL